MELWTRLLRGAFEGELIEEGWRCVRCDSTVVEFTSRSCDGRDYEVVRLWDVLSSKLAFV
jgi:hypothetical protein